MLLYKALHIHISW